jgi:hypothetical protein|tara:strand:+ start:2201 stop:2446 length:246 start_codon:yes stop_codon:yes gene_type:complete
MADDMEKFISKVVMDLMLEAHDKGITLTFKDICRMVGIPDEIIEEGSDQDAHFVLNQDLIDALEDKDLRDAMIERSLSTLH